MQQAAVPGFKLRRSKKSTKVLTTLGLFGLLFGLLGAVALTLTRTGITPDAVSRYYRGAPLASTNSLDSLDALTTPAVPRPFGELAEVTHLHLMGGSLLLFLLCHLLSVCDISERTRIFWYSLSFGSFLLTFSLPWAIVYLSPWFCYLMGPTTLVLTVSLVLITAIPLWEMWHTR